MKPGSKVLYLGAASGTTVSHVSDIVGPVASGSEVNGRKALSTPLNFRIVLAAIFST